MTTRLLAQRGIVFVGTFLFATSGCDGLIGADFSEGTLAKSDAATSSSRCSFGSGACDPACEPDRCGDRCVALASDPVHCGTCTTACLGAAACVARVCSS